jgi:hypothetical protein
MHRRTATRLRGGHQRLDQSGELIRNEASELSIIKGTEPPWIARRAAAQGRYATPEEGGRYYGKTPPCAEQRIRVRRLRPHGSRQLGRVLRQYG